MRGSVALVIWPNRLIRTGAPKFARRNSSLRSSPRRKLRLGARLMFSAPGPRMLDAPQMMEHVIEHMI
jgi:hypothetical protein